MQVVNDYDGFVRKDRKFLPSYRCWSDMIRRVRDGRAGICNEWLVFSNFRLWFEDNYVDGCELDKDLYGDGVYSPETCVFLPPHMNKRLQAGRGVQYRKDLKKKPYRAYIKKCGIFVHLGYFETEELAREEYLKEYSKIKEEIYEYIQQRK